MDPNTPQNNPAPVPNQPVQPAVTTQPTVVPPQMQPAASQAPMQPVQPVAQQPMAQPQTAAPQQPQPMQPAMAMPQQPVAQQMPMAQPMAPAQVMPQQPMAPQSPMPGQPVPPAPVGGPAAAPAYGQHPRSKGLKIATIVLTVIAILVCSYGAFHVFQVRKAKYGFAANQDKARKEQIKKAVEASKPETEKRTDGKLNLSKLFDNEKSPHDQDINAGLNEQVNMADGFSFMVTGVEHNYVRPLDYETQAAPGKEYIKVAIVIGNRAEQGTISFYSINLSLLNSKGGKQDPVAISDKDIPNNGLSDYSQNINLNPADQRSGWIVYEVDKGETPISIHYEQKGYACASNNDKDCLMKGTVKIQ